MFFRPEQGSFRPPQEARPLYIILPLKRALDPRGQKNIFLNKL
jgi:hypothetical protein